MTRFKGACFAAALATTAGISTAASAQFVGVDVGPAGVGVGFGQPYYGYYDEDVVVTRAPRAYRSWTPSRDSACIQDRRDFAERRTFICR